MNPEMMLRSPRTIDERRETAPSRVRDRATSKVTSTTGAAAPR